MSNRLFCPQCGSSDAHCAEERGWHVHVCHGCGYQQTFSKGGGHFPAHILPDDPTVEGEDR